MSRLANTFGMEGADLKDCKDDRRYSFEEDLPPRRGSLSILDSLRDCTAYADVFDKMAISLQY